MSVETAFPTEVQATIRLLRQRFVDGLEDRILQTEAAALRLRQDPADAAARDALQRDCHKIAGLAATLGFAGLGQLAATIDRKLLQADDWGKIAPLVEDLMDHMEAALD